MNAHTHLSDDRHDPAALTVRAEQIDSMPTETPVVLEISMFKSDDSITNLDCW